MMLNYSPEQLQLLYEKLPEELKKAIFSSEVAENIYNICMRYNLEEQMSEIAKNVGYIFLGLLVFDELEKVLTNELKISAEIAKKISFEINRFILFPLKSSIEGLYQKEIKPLKPEEISEGETSKIKQDVYRETIE